MKKRMLRTGPVLVTDMAYSAREKRLDQWRAPVPLPTIAITLRKRPRHFRRFETKKRHRTDSCPRSIVKEKAYISVAEISSGLNHA